MSAALSRFSWQHTIAALVMVFVAACGGGSGSKSAAATDGSNTLAGLSGSAGDQGAGASGSGSTTGQTGDAGASTGSGSQVDGSDTGTGNGTGITGSGNPGGATGTGDTGNAGNDPGGTGSTGNTGNDGNPGDGGTGNTGNTDTPADIGTKIVSGAFIPAISGMSYIFGELGLITGTDGDFRYITVDGVKPPVKFTVGGVVLGSVVPHTCLSPLSLISGADAQFNADSRVAEPAIALMRFLMSLDEDRNPENGIAISTTTHLEIFSIPAELRATVNLDPSSAEFGTESNLRSFFALLNQTVGTDKYVLVSEDSAMALLKSVLSSCHSVRYEGSYTSEWSDVIFAIGQPAVPLDPNPQPYSIVINGQRFDGTLSYGGKNYEISGTVDPAGKITVERMYDRPNNREVSLPIATDASFQGQFDAKTQKVELKLVIRGSTTA